MKRAPNIK